MPPNPESYWTREEVVAPRTPAIHRTAVVEGTVGEGTIIGAHAYIGALVTIGRDCVIGPGTCIGQDGFGYFKDEWGHWVRKPQSHGVVIGDRVDIGANVCIDRGSYRDTVIGSGTKIDNLVHLSHNLIVGENCLIIACAEISGSVEIGEGVWIGPNASIREHLKIGAHAFVGLGAVVVRDVPDNATMVGNPARVIETGKQRPNTSREAA